MDEVWCGLDLQLPSANDVPGVRGAADDDPFWPALADCAASFLAVDDIDITGPPSDKVVGGMVMDMDASCFMPEEQHERTYSSSPPSSKRSLSMDDSAGTISSPFFFALDGADASLADAGVFDPFAGDDAAIMRAMMAVLSSASPSSSESSSPPQSQETISSIQQAAAVYPYGENNNNNNYYNGHVAVGSITSLAVAPEQATSLTNSLGGGRQEQERVAANNNNSSQVYHMMSERKRREKLNDSFQTLRSLLPPCSKKDKTTVLINAASYLKKLESEVSELEEKNAKLERHVPRDDGGAAASVAAQRRAKIQISRAASDADQMNLTVMMMVECDIVDLVLHVLERLRWMAGVSVLSVDADTYSRQVLLKAIASIKLQITDGDAWNEASFHEAMKKVVHEATSSAAAGASAAPQVATA